MNFYSPVCTKEKVRTSRQPDPPLSDATPSGLLFFRKLQPRILGFFKLGMEAWTAAYFLRRFLALQKISRSKVRIRILCQSTTHPPKLAMASDTIEKKEKKKDKKEKKEKKVKTGEDGVTKSKSEKKDKKEKKEKKKALAQQVETDGGALIAATRNGDVDAMELDFTVRELPIGALVPFANPLADEQQTKKLLGIVRQGMYIVI
jgi:hypothetical protein